MPSLKLDTASGAFASVGVNSGSYGRSVFGSMRSAIQSFTCTESGKGEPRKPKDFCWRSAPVAKQGHRRKRNARPRRMHG